MNAPALTIRTMGTVASITVPMLGPADEDARGEHLRAELAALLDGFERRFSLYRPDAELRRVADGLLPLTLASEELREAYARAVGWSHATAGAFQPIRPDGVLDLSGIVKALAIQAVAEHVRALGAPDALVSIGGDAVALGSPSDGGCWVAGVVDPSDRRALVAAFALDPRHPAIATSGTSERGEHVWRSGPADYRQVTVVAADIVTADVAATAILSGGATTRDALIDRLDIDVLTIDPAGAMAITPRLRQALRRPAAPVPFDRRARTAP